MMSRWGIENDDGWFIVYKDGVEVASSENGDRMADVLNDAFHDANARIAELEAERRWIPVSERLPENISNVLILSRGEQLIASYHSKYSLWYVPFVDKPVVTHWMPLPELPEVKE